MKHITIFLLLVCSIYSQAQNTIQLNPEKGKTYSYTTHIYSAEEQLYSQLEWTANKNDLSVYNVEQKLNSAYFISDFFEMHTEVFHNPTHRWRDKAITSLCKETIHSELTENGVLIKSDFFPQIESIVGEMKEYYMAAYESVESALFGNLSFAYVGKELELGGRFKTEYQPIFCEHHTIIDDGNVYNNSFTFSVNSIEKNVTTLHFTNCVNVTDLSDKIICNGVMVVENTTGMPIYIAEVTNYPSGAVVRTTSRSDFDGAIASNYSNLLDFKNDNYYHHPTFMPALKKYNIPKNKQQAQKILEKVKVDISEGYTNRLRFSNRNTYGRCIVDSVEFTYVNREKRTIHPSVQDTFPSIAAGYSRYNLGMLFPYGDDCPLLEATFYTTLFKSYGAQTIHVSKKEYLRNKEHWKRYILEWVDNEIVIVNAPIQLMSNNKAVDECVITPYFPDFTLAAQNLNMKEAEVSTAQAFLYANPQAQLTMIKFSTKQRIDEVIIPLIEGQACVSRQFKYINAQEQ